MELALALKISLLCSVGEKGLYSPRMLGFPLLDGSFSLPCFFNTCRYFLFFFFSCCIAPLAVCVGKGCMRGSPLPSLPRTAIILCLWRRIPSISSVREQQKNPRYSAASTSVWPMSTFNLPLAFLQPAHVLSHMCSAQINAKSWESENLPRSRYAIVELLVVNKQIHLTTSASEGHLLFFSSMQTEEIACLLAQGWVRRLPRVWVPIDKNWFPCTLAEEGSLKNKNLYWNCFLGWESKTD